MNKRFCLFEMNLMFIEYFILVDKWKQQLN